MLAILPFLAGCGDWFEDDEPDPEPIALTEVEPDSIIIYPSVVQAPVGSTFQLRARVFWQGNVIPPSMGPSLEWTPSGSALKRLSQEGHTASFRVDEVATDAVQISAAATTGSASGSNTITITQPDGDPNVLTRINGVVLDTDETSDVTSAAPAVPSTLLPRPKLVATGTESSPGWNSVAFVNKISLSAVTEDSLFVLADNFEAVLSARIAAPSAAAIATRRIEVKVWIPEALGDGGTAPDYVVQDIASASRVLKLNRTGLALILSDVETYPYEMSTECSVVRQRDDKRFNVYYVGEVNYRGGKACLHGTRDIIISRYNAEPTTFIHELAHALGLYHTTYEPGFGEYPDNLMRMSNYDAADDRSHLSVGQVFRLNWDAYSALFRGELNVHPRPASHSRDCLTTACPLLHAGAR